MSRMLWVLRHGKSSWKDPALRDEDRPLAKRGRRDVPRVAAWLRERGVVPDAVVSSPAKRAWQTAERFCGALGCDVDVRYDERVYAATCDALLEVLADAPSRARHVLLVGHNPGLEELVEVLCGSPTPSSPDEKMLPTAALVGVDLPDDWRALRREAGRMCWLVRPRSLRGVREEASTGIVGSV